MWIVWALRIAQILWFAFQHRADIKKVVDMIIDFLKAHRRNPNLKSWVAGFGESAEEAKRTRDPKALEEFLAKLRAEVAKGGG